jgi:ABC-type transport system involved in Fe-S cluster assembly fused permease/ATPase subunit
MQRLEEQARWYEKGSRRNKRAYLWLKVAQIVIAAAIPAVAAAGASAGFAGALGAVVVVLEGVQQLFQFQQNWIAYRNTAEALSRERHLYEARAAHYAEAQHPDRLLAERVEALISQEHAAWTEVQREDKAA